MMKQIFLYYCVKLTILSAPMFQQGLSCLHGNDKNVIFNAKGAVETLS